jgi:hypothetical protein
MLMKEKAQIDQLNYDIYKCALYEIIMNDVQKNIHNLKNDEQISCTNNLTEAILTFGIDTDENIDVNLKYIKKYMMIYFHLIASLFETDEIMNIMTKYIDYYEIILYSKYDMNAKKMKKIKNTLIEHLTNQIIEHNQMMTPHDYVYIINMSTTKLFKNMYENKLITKICNTLINNTIIQQSVMKEKMITCLMINLFLNNTNILNNHEVSANFMVYDIMKSIGTFAQICLRTHDKHKHNELFVEYLQSNINDFLNIYHYCYDIIFIDNANVESIEASDKRKLCKQLLKIVRESKYEIKKNTPTMNVIQSIVSNLKKK